MMIDRNYNKNICDYIFSQYDYRLDETEKDFYCLSDDRVWISNVEDIEGGDNFADYCEEFFKLLIDEEYYDN